MKNTTLITGGSQRIGKAICEKLAKEGYNIAIHYNKSKKQAISLKNKFENYNIKVCCIKANLSNEKELKNLFIKVKKKIGIINCLINNASTFELDDINNINKKKMGLKLNYQCLGSNFFNTAIYKEFAEKNWW